METPDQPTVERAELSPERRRSRRLVAVAAGITVALGAGGVAYAASTTPTPTPSTAAPSETTPDEESPFGNRPMHGPPGFIGGLGGLGGIGGVVGFGVLHAELVVETADGTYETFATQRGTVDEVSEDSLTVTSEDGYSRTYVIEADSLVNSTRGGIADVEVGDEVVVTAEVDGDTATARRVVDTTALAEHDPRPFGGDLGTGRDESADS